MARTYDFYGWQTADAVPVSREYPGIHSPIDLYDALAQIWCAETCAPRMRDRWTPENRILGQCSITAFLAQDIFGGEVYGILREGGNYHCYNVIGDCCFDLTSEQFGDEAKTLVYENNPAQLREVHFAKEEKRLRYEYLRAQLAAYCRARVPVWAPDALQWTRQPADCVITADRIEIVTAPYTDLWQRTYYHFRNDNAPVLQMETDAQFFSFTVRTDFSGSHHRFDQCGAVVYLDSENWLKCAVEYENEQFQHLGSVVTNQGFSDWATTEIPASVSTMWYRLSRRADDFCIECSEDGQVFRQMRVCHMHRAAGAIRFGIYACSPEDSSFRAVFTDMTVTECQWPAHDGQPPDED